jgi:hypothetical protein
MKITKEALTLHLYRYEEVIAALQWAIIHHLSEEAVFWGLELYDSGLMDDVFEVLMDLWAQHIGFGKHGLATLYNMIKLQQCDDLDRDIWIYSLYIWSNIRTMDTTGFQLLVRGSTIPVEWNLNFSHKCEYKSLDAATTDCLTRGKLTEAWLIARAIPSERQWLLLNELSQKKERVEIFNILKGLQLSDCVKRAICFILLTVSVPTLIQSLLTPKLDSILLNGLPEEIALAIENWDSEESIRKRRKFKIRPEAIWNCSRSFIDARESNFIDIQMNLEKSLILSPCWQSILEDYMEPGKEGQWKSDAYREMFYKTYFPCSIDDIPDEWSLKDKEQSHGLGFGKKFHSALRQYINNIIRDRSCIGLYISIQNVNEYNDLSLEWDPVYEAIKEKASPYLEAKLPFKPLVKVLRPLD